MLFEIGTTLAVGAMPCAPVENAGRLLDDHIRWVIVGEVHGTNEVPNAFANLVCLATRTNRPVTVAVEFSSDWQSAIDRFLASDGGAEAKKEFIELPRWQGDYQDGRTSIAMFRLFENLRVMKQAGVITGVAATDVPRIKSSTGERDAAMAEAWQNLATGDNNIVLALTGNIHSMRIAWARPDATIETAGSLMPAAQTVTMNVVGNGGEAWNCQSDGCGAHQVGSLREAETSLRFSDQPTAPWTVTYELGMMTTAARPAVQIVERTKQ